MPLTFSRCRGGRALAILAGAAAILGAMPTAWAQSEAARAVRIVVPAPPGGSLDGGARVLAQRLTAITGETHVVENRPGANTLIGTESVVRAQPDGRTMLYAGVSLVTNALLQKLSFSPLEDLRPVIGIANEHYALIAAASLPARSAAELPGVAAARPGGLNCAAPPGPMALACEQLRRRLQGASTTIPFAGISPALSAVAGSHVDVTFVPVETAGRLIEARAAKVLAVSRAPATTAPGTGAPLLAELWPGFVLEAVQGIYVPARTPEARVRQLHAALAQVLTEPDSIARIRAIGQEPRQPESPESFARLMASFVVRYGDLVRSLDLAQP